MNYNEKIKIIFALIGLVGAMQNNAKTKNTDQVILDALLSDTTDAAIEKIHKEKNKISPNCASCKMRCGNTDDYTLAKYEALDENIKNLWEEMITYIIRLAKQCIESNHEITEQYMLKAIAYLGYDLAAESYVALIEEIDRNIIL